MQIQHVKRLSASQLVGTFWDIALFNLLTEAAKEKGSPPSSVFVYHLTLIRVGGWMGGWGSEMCFGLIGWMVSFSLSFWQWGGGAVVAAAPPLMTHPPPPLPMFFGWQIYQGQQHREKREERDLLVWKEEDALPEDGEEIFPLFIQKSTFRV